jgi:hypothetical protein
VPVVFHDTVGIESIPKTGDRQMDADLSRNYKLFISSQSTALRICEANAPPNQPLRQ